MALRSVLQIDIDDSAFTQFQQRFNAFNARYGRQPGGAQSPSQAQQTFARGAQTVSKAARDTQTASEKMAAALKTSTEHIGRALRGLQEMASTMLRITGLAGLFGGIIGGLGFDKLSRDVSAGRRNAIGLGSTYGGATAFGINYGRFVDPNAFLGAVSGAAGDLQQRQLFAALGIRSPTPGEDTSSVADRALDALRNQLRATPENQLAQRLTVTGADKFMSLEDARRLRNASPEEYRQQRAQFAQDQRGLDLPPGVQRQWTDFGNTMERVKASLENTFVRLLAPLAVPIAKFAQSLQRAIGTLTENKDLGKWIEDFGKTIETWAKKLKDYIESGALSEALQNFVDDIKEAGQAIHDGLRRLHLISSTPEEEERDAAEERVRLALLRAQSLTQSNPTITGPEGEPPSWGGLGRWIKRGWNRVMPGQEPGAPEPGAPPNIPLGAQRSSFLTGLEQQKGLPGGVLNAIEQRESGGRGGLVSSAGARGYFQFMPATARQYGVTNPNDEGMSARGAASYFADLMREFHGDIRKALAGYNWGEGRVEAAIKAFGDAWLAHAPRQTQDYVAGITGRLGLPQQPSTFRTASAPVAHVHVTIRNQTGGNAIIAGSQLA